MKDFETGWDRTDRLLLNLIKSIELEEDFEKKNEYQNLIDKITKKSELKCRHGGGHF